MKNHSNIKAASDDPATTGRRKAAAHLEKLDGVEETPFIEIHKSPCQLGSKNNAEEKYSELPTCSQNASYYFSQFCDATSIHGIKYLGERGRFLVEKIFWAIVIAVVCLLCIFLISKTYIKWVRTPVIVTFATTETGIWNIPFPAVTICPDIKFKPEIFNFTRTVFQQLLDQENETEYFNTLSLACDNAEELLDDVTDFVNQTLVISHLLLALPDLNPHNVTDVIWLGKKHKLDDVLSLTLTGEGLCYSFNMLHHEEILKYPQDKLAQRSLPNFKSTKWSLEGGYASDDRSSYPRRTFLSGIHGGVVFNSLFANQSHMDFLCTEGVRGFKVTLHHPLELPNMDKHFRVPVDHAVNIAIKPKMIVVSEELKPYDPEVRKCYFDGEKPLAFFQSYTQQNCLDECLWNYTLANCDCVAFHMTVNTDPPGCSLGKVHCMEQSRVNYLADKDNSCNCLPPCTSLEYDVEVTQSPWDWQEVFDLFKPLGILEEDDFFRQKEAHFSTLAVFYKDQQFLASERHELYGYIDFFANVGGLLGLFIGFSVTSLLEIVYFLSLRLGCNVKKFGRNFWSGEPELLNAEAKRD